MEHLTKQENKEAFDAYFTGRTSGQSLTDSEMIAKFKEQFMKEELTQTEKGKYRDTVDFTIGAARASFNRDKSAVFMCEMPSSITLGLTRNMSIVDLTTHTEYSLKYGKGYKNVRDFIKSL